MAAEAAALRALRAGRPVAVAEDAAEMAVATAPSEAPPLTYHLTYRDSVGVESRRVVTLRRVDPDRRGLMLVCWCHSAGALRCFNLSGIVEIFDVVNGEVHDNPAAFFSNHPLLTEPKDPVDYALQVCKHEVNVLVAVGAADGRFDMDEQDRVLIHVFDRMPDLTMDEELMRQRLCRFAPDMAAFEAAMLQMGRFRRGDPVALLRSLRKLVEVDGVLSREEVLFVSELQAQLAGASGD